MLPQFNYVDYSPLEAIKAEAAKRQANSNSFTQMLGMLLSQPEPTQSPVGGAGPAPLDTSGASRSATRSMPTPTGGGSLEQLMHSIGQQESGGRYTARNSMSGAMGKYQIMPANLGGTHSGWDWEALGRDITPQQFMNSPQLQEAIARYKLGQYLQKYGAAGAAKAWYGGPGAVKASGSAATRTQAGGYPSINNYAASVVGRMR